jgi:hypothetical protein
LTIKFFWLPSLVTWNWKFDHQSYGNWIVFQSPHITKATYMQWIFFVHKSWCTQPMHQDGHQCEAQHKMVVSCQFWQPL